MKLIKLLGLASTIFILSCQADPGPKKIPLEDKKLIDKSLNDISFNPSVDILFIIDDSGSMFSVQKQLAANSKLFIEQFFNTKFIDYHIGVTTSSLFDSSSKAPGGQLRNVEGYTYVDRITPAGDIVLSNMLNVGTSGSATEQFFSIHMNTFAEPLLSGANRGFYREDAQLAIFVITDTEDQSSFSALEAYEFLRDLKNKDERKLHYAAALVHVDPNCRSSENMDPRKIRSIIELFQERGYKFSLCQPNYGEDLATVATRLIRSASTVYLDQLPDVTTLQVFYGDQRLLNDPLKGWVYDPDRNAIILSAGIEIDETVPQSLRVKFEAVYK